MAALPQKLSFATYASNEIDIPTFYNELSSLVQTFSLTRCSVHQKRHECTNRNNKFCLHSSSNRNGEYQADFSLKKKFFMLKH